ncbi:MAG TPA: hypothetical protein HA298_02135 [Methanobacteriales archaeon]|nr:MAG: Uncharacterized protein XD44_1157 [Methanobacteriaceae archaeon 41_258]MBC7090040.1 hypothetical protein [Methanobacteriaceae archaeon]HIH61474.1 hypothetical protein [Methanobacteriales archaeon]
MEYEILIPSMLVIGLYIITYGLYKKGLVNRRWHVNLWNLIIFIAFIISGIGGFILLFMLEYGLKAPFNQQLLYWHVEAGVGLVIITIFHFHYYKGSVYRVFGVR